MLLSACSRSSFIEELNTIDSLITEYNELQILVDSISTFQAKYYLDSYKQDIELIKKTMNPEKMPSLEDSQYIDAFRSIKKTFKKQPRKKASLQNNIKKNLDQLNHLKSDVKKQTFDPTSIQSFLQQEEMLLQKLQKEHADILQQVREEIAKYDSLKILLPKKLKSLSQ